MAGKQDAARGKGKGKPARARAKPSRMTAPPIVESNAPPPVDEATAAPPQASGAAQPQAAAQQQTTISTSRGFVDFLSTNRLSLALTSYQTGQLMLIGPLLDGRLSVFQRNFMRAMGLAATPQRLYLSTIAQIWRLENVLGRGSSPRSNRSIIDRLLRPAQCPDDRRHRCSTSSPSSARAGLIFVNTKYLLPRRRSTPRMLQAALEAVLHLAAGAGGSLPSERSRHARGRAGLCHGGLSAAT